MRHRRRFRLFPPLVNDSEATGSRSEFGVGIICHCKLEVEQHVQGGLLSQGSMVFPLDFSKYCIGA